MTAIAREKNCPRSCRSSSIRVLAIGLLLACAMRASVAAAVSPIAPFTGALIETWESRPNYMTPTFHFEPSPTTIMGGGATLTGQNMGIYEPSTTSQTNFLIGSPQQVPAQVSDGTKGLALSSASALATLVFSVPVTDFGAYWATGSPSNGAIVSFYDENVQLIDAPVLFSYTRNGSFPGGDGVLEWHGWHSGSPIKSLTIQGDYVAIDGLRANPVPEPGSAALVLCGLCLLARAEPGQWRRRIDSTARARRS